MAETKEKEVTGRPVFRNASARVYGLKRRPHQAEHEVTFPVRPGETVVPIDDAEQKLLEGIDEFRDVAKEAPAIGNQIDALKAQLADALAENAKLKADKADDEDEDGKKKGKK